MKKSIANPLKFNDATLKIFGIVFMSIDHFYLYVCSNIISIDGRAFRIVGRIAAPLFLFAVTQAMHHSSNRKHYILRLYIYHIAICIVEHILSYITASQMSFNVIPEWLFTAIYIFLIDEIIKKKNIIINIILLFIPLTLGMGMIITGFSDSWWTNMLLPNIFLVCYSPFFIILGISWYYIRTKKIQLLTLSLFSVFVFCGAYIASNCQSWVYTGLFNYTQIWMILAAPLLRYMTEQEGKT